MNTFKAILSIFTTNEPDESSSKVRQQYTAKLMAERKRKPIRETHLSDQVKAEMERETELF